MYFGKSTKLKTLVKIKRILFLLKQFFAFEGVKVEFFLG